MAEEIISTIKKIEAEAEKVLEDAKAKATEVIIKAKDEANKIQSSALSVGTVNKEC